MSEEQLGIIQDGEPVAVETIEPTTEAPVVKTEDHAGEESGEVEQHKKKTGSQRAREALQREREARIRLETELEILRRNGAPAQKAVDSDAPKLEDFDTHADWVNATVQHGIRKALESERNKAQANTWQERWEPKAEKAREKYEDFDDALAYMPPLPRHIAEVLAESDAEADLAYHLATHPEDVKRLQSMSPSLAGRELARLEAKFAAPAPKPERKSTAAPPPPNPVGAKGTPATDPSKWTDAEWAVHRRAQLKR